MFYYSYHIDTFHHLALFSPAVLTSVGFVVSVAGTYAAPANFIPQCRHCQIAVASRLTFIAPQLGHFCGVLSLPSSSTINLRAFVPYRGPNLPASPTFFVLPIILPDMIADFGGSADGYLICPFEFLSSKVSNPTFLHGADASIFRSGYRYPCVHHIFLV
jgi:hypothetical protein